MVQAVENWCWLTGQVQGCRELAQYLELEMRVDASMAVEGYPDLLEQYLGQTVRIRIAGAAAPGTGQQVRLRARLAGPGVIWGDADTLALEPGRRSAR
ncbi:hypothetical protein [Herbaspirillum sp. SJZ107]|uniref:hypothetical protein n=1 Tax=Herbaspirillum sp. SJZ107 TaxID=2572881 RepID=UPI0011521F3D|nr:hypothetical protein [Herbaspirillum sp. SJZ107]TQK01274.1 hypothetical protein FBX97_5803 [Herbaspirillum sp. SJZ107]